MHRFYKLLILPLLDVLAPRVIVEVGADIVGVSRPLLAWAQDSGAVLHVIDPDPALSVERLEADHGEHLRFHRARSLEVLETIENVELALIDGDHNWFTVINELRSLDLCARQEGRDPPVILVHETGWPYGRRDSYRDPDAIPEAHRHPHARRGVVPGQAELGAGLNEDREHALLDNTPANGVLSAVEDFIGEPEGSWRSWSVRGLGGLEILVSAATLASNAALRELLDSIQTPAFLLAQCEAIESARIQSECKRAALLRRLGETQLKQIMRSPDPRETVALKRRARELGEQVRELSQDLERVEELEERLRLLADGRSGALSPGGGEASL